MIFKQWLFTCSMEPKQFHSFTHTDDFITICNYNSLGIYGCYKGSYHSVRSCGLVPISRRYARWFKRNKLWKWYDFFKKTTIKFNNQWFKEDKYWYRIADNKLAFYYTKYIYSKSKGRYHRGYKTIQGLSLSFIKYRDFIFYPKKGFNIKIDTFLIYEAYIKHLCKKQNKFYQGI